MAGWGCTVFPGTILALLLGDHGIVAAMGDWWMAAFLLHGAIIGMWGYQHFTEPDRIRWDTCERASLRRTLAYLAVGVALSVMPAALFVWRSIPSIPYSAGLVIVLLSAGVTIVCVDYDVTLLDKLTGRKPWKAES